MKKLFLFSFFLLLFILPQYSQAASKNDIRLSFHHVLDREPSSEEYKLFASQKGLESLRLRISNMYQNERKAVIEKIYLSALKRSPRTEELNAQIKWISHVQDIKNQLYSSQERILALENLYTSYLGRSIKANEKDFYFKTRSPFEKIFAYVLNLKERRERVNEKLANAKAPLLDLETEALVTKEKLPLNNIVDVLEFYKMSKSLPKDIAGFKIVRSEETPIVTQAPISTQPKASEGIGNVNGIVCRPSNYTFIQAPRHSGPVGNYDEVLIKREYDMCFDPLGLEELCTKKDTWNFAFVLEYKDSYTAEEYEYMERLRKNIPKEFKRATQNLGTIIADIPTISIKYDNSKYYFEKVHDVYPNKKFDIVLYFNNHIPEKAINESENYSYYNFNIFGINKGIYMPESETDFYASNQSGVIDMKNINFYLPGNKWGQTEGIHDVHTVLHEFGHMYGFNFDYINEKGERSYDLRYVADDRKTISPHMSRNIALEEPDYMGGSIYLPKVYNDDGSIKYYGQRAYSNESYIDMIKKTVFTNSMLYAMGLIPSWELKDMVHMKNVYLEEEEVSKYSEENMYLAGFSIPEIIPASSILQAMGPRYCLDKYGFHKTDDYFR